MYFASWRWGMKCKIKLYAEVNSLFQKSLHTQKIHYKCTTCTQTRSYIVLQYIYSFKLITVLNLDIQSYYLQYTCPYSTSETNVIFLLILSIKFYYISCSFLHITIIILFMSRTSNFYNPTTSNYHYNLSNITIQLCRKSVNIIRGS